MGDEGNFSLHTLPNGRFFCLTVGSSKAEGTIAKFPIFFFSLCFAYTTHEILVVPFIW